MLLVVYLRTSSIGLCVCPWLCGSVLGLADIVCMCVHVYQSVTKTAVQHKILIHQIPLPTPFVLLSLSSLFFFSYSTVHSAFVSGFLFHWINLSRCPAENVLYLDKQKESIAAWRLYIS